MRFYLSQRRHRKFTCAQKPESERASPTKTGPRPSRQKEEHTLRYRGRGGQGGGEVGVEPQGLRVKWGVTGAVPWPDIHPLKDVSGCSAENRLGGSKSQESTLVSKWETVGPGPGWWPRRW